MNQVGGEFVLDFAALKVLVLAVDHFVGSLFYFLVVVDWKNMKKG